MTGTMPLEISPPLTQLAALLRAPLLGEAPFFAINGHLRQENDFGCNLDIQTGWQWRGRGGHLFRLGMQYFNGMSDQYQFFNQFEEQIGVGVWYDY